MDLLGHANSYLSLGFAVLPLHFPFERGGHRLCSCTRDDCRHPAKHPFGSLVRNGIKDATKDPKTVTRWFNRASLNIGIATGAISGIVVLDIDPRHDGDESLSALENQFGALPDTWRFLTGGGGEHILFRHPGGVITNSAGKIGHGIDLRGDGGYIVAPPSQHMNGRRYAISVDHDPELISLADMPEWLFDLLNPAKDKAQPGKTTADWRSITGGGAINGERNITITRLAGMLLGRRIDPHVCLDLMLAFNASRCSPPLADDEVASAVASIARREFASRATRRQDGKSHG